MNNNESQGRISEETYSEQTAQQNDEYTKRGPVTRDPDFKDRNSGTRIPYIGNDDQDISSNIGDELPEEDDNEDVKLTQ